MAIYFYSTREAYGGFSNFSAHPIEVDGKRYPTTEHYFQAQKYAGVNPEREEAIRTASSPRQAADMGRDRAYPLRPDWEAVKEDVMLTALRAKFGQHPALRDLLLSTGTETLVEKTTGDYYWGCGTRGDGQNRLGVLLEVVRGELRQ